MITHIKKTPTIEKRFRPAAAAVCDESAPETRRRRQFSPRGLSDARTGTEGEPP